MNYKNLNKKQLIAEIFRLNEIIAQKDEKIAELHFDFDFKLQDLIVEADYYLEIIEDQKSKIEILYIEIENIRTDHSKQVEVDHLTIMSLGGRINELLAENSKQYGDSAKMIDTYFDKYMEYSNKYNELLKGNQQQIYIFVEKKPKEEYPRIMYGDDTVEIRFKYFPLDDEDFSSDDDIKSHDLEKFFEKDYLEMCPNHDEMMELARHNIYCNSLTDL